jgi:hypothetical protein
VPLKSRSLRAALRCARCRLRTARKEESDTAVVSATTTQQIAWLGVAQPSMDLRDTSSAQLPL